MTTRWLLVTCNIREARNIFSFRSFTIIDSEFLSVAQSRERADKHQTRTQAIFQFDSAIAILKWVDFSDTVCTMNQILGQCELHLGLV